MSEVKTLARGLQILERLAEAEDGLTSTELADYFEVDKASMSRLLSTLEAHRFADRDPDTRRYYLGTHVQELGRRAGQHAMLRELVQPYLQRLGAETDENAHVGIAASTYALTIADVPSTEPLRVVSEVGRHLPLHCSAIGKCLLAFVKLNIPASLPRFTANTLTEPSALEADLLEIRRRGYALDDEELTLGVRGLAAPIRNREGRTIAAIGLSGPTVRLTNAQLPQMAAFLMRTAEEVSAELGFQADA